MKIRNGFVSNSSSASFILAVEPEMVAFANLRSLLFDNNEYVAVVDGQHVMNGEEIPDSCIPPTMPIDAIVGYLFGQFESVHSVEIYELVTDVAFTIDNWDSWFDDTLELNYDSHEYRRQDHFMDLERIDEAAKQVRAFVEANATCKFRQVQAGSGGGRQTEIGMFIATNHARIFKNVNYLETGLL